jgi:hypothetical protein
MKGLEYTKNFSPIVKLVALKYLLLMMFDIGPFINSMF